MPNIKTYIKFSKGLDGMDSRIYGFVTKQKGNWRGCRQDSPLKKKIVFPDVEIEPEVIPDALYQCTLIPMSYKHGFIATTAKLVKFTPTIETRTKHLQVAVHFGNKTIVYDPASRNPKRNNIQSVADWLRNRQDLVDPNTAAEDFISLACIVKRLYEQRP